MVTRQKVNHKLHINDILLMHSEQLKLSHGNGGNNNNNNDGGGGGGDDDSFGFSFAKPKIMIKVACKENLFGNANFTKGKEYLIKETNNLKFQINTDYDGCNLPCVITNNRASDKMNNICFGLCLFRIADVYYFYEMED